MAAFRRAGSAGLGCSVSGQKTGQAPLRRLVCCSVTPRLLCLLSAANVGAAERPGAAPHGQGGWCGRAACPSSPCPVAAVRAGWSCTWRLSRALGRRLPQRQRAVRTQPCLPNGSSAPSFRQRTAYIASLKGIL